MRGRAGWRTRYGLDWPNARRRPGASNLDTAELSVGLQLQWVRGQLLHPAVPPITPVRIVCANTQRMALRQAKATYAIRHTRTARAKIAQARQALGIVWRYTEAFETEAQQLINQTLVLDEFQVIVDQLWPTDPTDMVGPRATGIRERRNTTLRGLFTDADTQHAIRGTRWAGLQAITEYLDHHTPARDDHVRATRVLTSHALAERKQRAYDLLTAL